jgi:BolA protein
MGQVADRIKQKLEQAFAPTALVIADESHLHAGHHGHTGRDETHFAVTLESAAFAGKGRVERQRMVYGVLADELKDRVHALRLSLGTPG